jgi:hypothetical protein
MAISAYKDGLKLDPQNQLLVDGLEELEVRIYAHVHMHMCFVCGRNKVNNQMLVVLRFPQLLTLALLKNTLALLKNTLALLKNTLALLKIP